MSKLLNSTLERISEHNNDYRKSLRKLNNWVDEITTALVGDIVTNSNYTTDFSSTITISKDKLVSPMLRVIESYVIRDLRSVETVNEQFIEKINDKIENTTINSKEDKEKFVSNLNTMLNEKYLQIVNIKRTPFVGENGNEDIETAINDFVNYLMSNNNYDEKGLSELINKYRNDVYNLINNTLSDISVLYLNNFVNEVNDDLRSIVDYDDNDVINNNFDDFKPFIPDINPVMPIDVPYMPDVSFEPEASSMPEINNNYLSEQAPLGNVPLDIPTSEEPVLDIITPLENNITDNVVKKKYDVEEILKIAKSPVVALDMNYEERISEPVLTESAKEPETFEIEFNEHEIVEEMIRRFTKRLEEIDNRQEKYDEDKKMVEDDEAFVKDLINSAEEKKSELDLFEEQLNDKEEELNRKEEELEKKINNVLPFANAVLENEKESL